MEAPQAIRKSRYSARAIRVTIRAEEHRPTGLLDGDPHGRKAADDTPAGRPLVSVPAVQLRLPPGKALPSTRAIILHVVYCPATASISIGRPVTRAYRRCCWVARRRVVRAFRSSYSMASRTKKDLSFVRLQIRFERHLSDCAVRTDLDAICPGSNSRWSPRDSSSASTRVFLASASPVERTGGFARLL